ncbi:MAG: alkaline phosphatase PhoX [Erythrobacter sp.]
MKLSVNMPTPINRRHFLGSTGSALAALAASGCVARSEGDGSLAAAETDGIYGPLVKDPKGVLDLPQGFAYRTISSLGDPMSDGGTVPDKADGMGCLDLGNGKIALVRNHELLPWDDMGGDVTTGYGRMPDGKIMAGGTTNIVLDAATLAVEKQHRTLAGTIRNCSGGVTPWGSWLTCEEPGSRGLELPEHGYVFEIPADADGLVDPVPLKALGRFNHEAACVDPETGMVYETEDKEDGLIYRFVPAQPGNLLAGGQLQALALVDGTKDSRNWESAGMAVGDSHEVRWIDLDNPESPDEDLRKRGAAQGALLIARGEGIHMGEDDLYLCSTSGGAAKVGQIFRLVPGRGAKPDTLELFFESESKAQFNYGDNLVVCPNGHLIVCEDQYTDVVDNRLIGIAPDGTPYPFGRLNMQTELAGACFSPDGKTMFVNAYSPTKTFAISGPWAA